MASKEEMRALTFDRSLGRADFGDFETDFRIEWLVTNGLGGYAAGTVIGSHTRRDHSLLVAALAVWEEGIKQEGGRSGGGNLTRYLSSSVTKRDAHRLWTAVAKSRHPPRTRGHRRQWEPAAPSRLPPIEIVAAGGSASPQMV